MAVGDKHLVTFGTEYRTNKVEGTRLGAGGDNAHSVDRFGNGVTTTKTYSEKEIDTYAAYIQDEWMPSEKWLIIPSLRYDHDSSFGGQATPKIGATYFVNNHNRIKANWGKGFKAPTISELYMQMNRSMGPGMEVRVYGNPDLEAEETNSWDISYEGEWNNNWGKVTYFQNDVTNLITSAPLPGSPSYNGMALWNIYKNIDKAQINGWELELGRNLNKNWTVKATSNWIDATDEADDSRLPNRAKNITTFQLSYDDNNAYGYSGILWYQFVDSYHYQSGTDAKNNPIYNDASYGTLNLTVNKKFGKGNRIFAGLDNIFDKKNYDVYLTGRTWVAGAEWTF